MANNDAQIYNSGNPTKFVIGSGDSGKTYGHLSTSQDAGGYFNIQSVSSSGSAFGNIILNSSGGNVGIGTINPNALFHLNGTFITCGNASNIDTNPSNARGNLNYLAQSANMLIGWNRSGGGGDASFISNQGNGWSGGFAFYNHDNYNLETQLMWIRGDGSVCIGTTDAHGFKLAVNGNIRAKEIKVESGPWPDYVFNKKYRLPLLTETEAYINKNHHLPEMPSAAQIEKGGLNLGEMNTKLLKKVEELTLYLIEKDKEVKAANRRIDRLSKRLDGFTKNSFFPLQIPNVDV